MEPALEIYDSEDEACLYLKMVQKEALNYHSRAITLGDSNPCEDTFIPQSQIPDGFKLQLSDRQKKNIIEKFIDFKNNLKKHLNPKEITRQKKLIKQFIYQSKPLVESIKELDQLTV